MCLSSQDEGVVHHGREDLVAVQLVASHPVKKRGTPDTGAKHLFSFHSADDPNPRDGTTYS